MTLISRMKFNHKERTERRGSLSRGICWDLPTEMPQHFGGHGARRRVWVGQCGCQRSQAGVGSNALGHKEGDSEDYVFAMELIGVSERCDQVWKPGRFQETERRDGVSGCDRVSSIFHQIRQCWNSRSGVGAEDREGERCVECSFAARAESKVRRDAGVGNAEGQVAPDSQAQARGFLLDPLDEEGKGVRPDGLNSYSRFLEIRGFLRHGIRVKSNPLGEATTFESRLLSIGETGDNYDGYSQARKPDEHRSVSSHGEIVAWTTRDEHGFHG